MGLTYTFYILCRRIHVSTGKTLWSSPYPERRCTNLWWACKFTYSYTAWSWSHWDICRVWYYHLSACSIFLYSDISEFLVTVYTKYILVLGGEDCNFRLWNIKSGKLIFEDKFVDAVPSTICWRRNGSNDRSLLFLSYLCPSAILFSIKLLVGFLKRRDRYLGCEDHSSGAWLGSQRGLHYVSWPGTWVNLYEDFWPAFQTYDHF